MLRLNSGDNIAMNQRAAAANGEFAPDPDWAIETC
jgi:hypothetical protein